MVDSNSRDDLDRITDAVSNKDRFELPNALSKSMSEPYDYALGLRNGTILYFSEASYQPGSEWVHLKAPMPGVEKRHGYIIVPFDHGLDVRLSEIAWVADSPYGR